jgi:membrane protein implicated in regulation of membrane protease activity
MRNINKKTATVLLIIEVLIMIVFFTLLCTNAIMIANDPPTFNPIVLTYCLTVMIIDFILYRRLWVRGDKRAGKIE